MSEPRVAFNLDREDFRVLLLYGRAMLSGQMLEFSVFQLAQLERRSPTDFERSMQQIEGLLKQPRRDQAKSLARLPEELRSEVLDALELRNRLAHHFLMEYRMTRGVSDTAVAWATEVLSAAITTFDGLNRELDQHAQTQLADAGIAELSEEEEEQLIESLERWSEDMLSAGDTDSAASEESGRETESS